MQRPPCLSWQHVESFAQFSVPGSQVFRLHIAISNLINGRHESRQAGDEAFCLPSLASLSSILWPVLYTRHNRHGTDNVLIESLSFWKPEFAEVACDTWLRTNGQTENTSILTIYHMMNIMLHGNLTALQSFAHSPPGSAAREPKKSLAAREIHAWTQDRHYKIAHWHAEHMIRALEKAFATFPPRTGQQFSNQVAGPASASSTETRRLPFEAPHVPYAVYYATLILWCGAAVHESTAASSASAQAQIGRGERILSLHKVHIAQLLARVLNEVK